MLFASASVVIFAENRSRGALHRGNQDAEHLVYGQTAQIFCDSKTPVFGYLKTESLGIIECQFPTYLLHDNCKFEAS